MVSLIDEQARREPGSRLLRLEGQTRSIKKMIEDEQHEATILVQLMAMQKASRAATSYLIQVRVGCLSGKCDHCDEFEAVERMLSDLDLDALLQTHLEVAE